MVRVRIAVRVRVAVKVKVGITVRTNLRPRRGKKQIQTVLQHHSKKNNPTHQPRLISNTAKPHHHHVKLKAVIRRECQRQKGGTLPHPRSGSNTKKKSKKEKIDPNVDPTLLVVP